MFSLQPHKQARKRTAERRERGRLYDTHDATAATQAGAAEEDTQTASRGAKGITAVHTVEKKGAPRIGAGFGTPTVTNTYQPRGARLRKLNSQVY